MKILFLFLSLTLISANALSQTTSRLWIVKNQNDPKTKIYLLAVTHLGLQAEYDSYLEKVIIPILDSSSVFHAEGIGGRENEPYPYCDNNALDEDGKKTVDHIKNEDINLAIKANEFLHQKQLSEGINDGTTAADRALYTRAFINSLDEFELIQDYRLNISRPKEANSENDSSQPSSDLFKEDIASFLIKQRPSLKLIDLDTKFGVRKAYCALGKDRIRFFTSMVNPEIIKNGSLNDKEIKLNENFLYFLNKKKLPDNSPWLELSELDKELLCNRTELWSKEISSFKDGKTHFIAAGIRHVFDNQNGPYQCKGLLSRLNDFGYSTELINLKN